ncbi:MAG TPA: hypothetical protein VN428_26950 [Bryobacteraceae bacterium]|nr:hypothetical protein [Bryobacteraceae bacterium]
MRRRFSPWLLLLLIAALCAAVLGTVVYLRSRAESTAKLLERLPANSTAVFYVDIDGLRKAGLMEIFGGSDMVREPEYRAFVEQTGFDYGRDLDSAILAFHSTGKYMLLRGRFNWALLKRYTETQGGTCRHAFCRSEGSTPERQISYFPVDGETMGLAVSSDSWAATQLWDHRKHTLRVPDKPVWGILSSAAWKDTATLPAGARAFALALNGVDRVLFTAGRASDGVELTMNVDCKSAGQAAGVVLRLRETTSTLLDLIRKEGQTPNPGDLSGILTSGAFEQRDTEVVGRWPVPRAFLASLAGGAL